MYKKWLSCALSVLCSFCLFWGLSLNTLVVKADTYNALDYRQSVSTTAHFNFGVDTAGQTSGTISSNSGGWGSFTNGTGNIQAISGGGGSITTILSTTYEGGTYHVKFPFQVKGTWSNTYNGNKLYKILCYAYDWSSNGGTISNLGFYSSDGKLLSTGTTDDASKGSVYYAKDSELCLVFSGNNFGYSQTFFCEFDISFDKKYTEGFDSSWSFKFRNYLVPASASEIASQVIETNDTQANESLDNIEQSTSTTASYSIGIFDTIRDFFGGFFNNIFNTILGLFVPDSSYFSTWFDNLNTLLSDKLGMLYAPFDLLISTLNAVYSADTTEPGITFPGITWDGQTVIEPYTFYFSSLGEDFQNLRDAVYFATDVVFLFAFLHLLQKKIALVITGSEVNG